MHYIAPLGATDPAQPYDDGNPLLGRRGSRPSGSTWNLIFAELLNVLDTAGLEPDPEDPTQVAAAIMMLATGGDMFKADNLGGLADIIAARANLGLGNNATGRANLGILQRRGTSIASAATTDLGSADSHYVQVTGTDTITSLGTGTARDFVMVEFTAACTLTHHAANLILPAAVDRVTAAGDRAIFVRRGAAASAQWICLVYQCADGLPIARNGTLQMRHQVASGTNGGSAVAATWNTRPINTVVLNEIAGASLSSNRFTLPAGTYRMLHCICCANGNHQNKTRLRNITTGSDVLLGVSADSDSATGSTGYSHMFGVFTITATTVFEIQQYSVVAGANTGLGRPVGAGVDEIYAEIVIEKIK